MDASQAAATDDVAVSAIHLPLGKPDDRALKGSVANYAIPRGSNLLGRLQDFADWADHRHRWGVEPFSKSTDAAPRATCRVRDRGGLNEFEGVNFGSQDYLSLASHPSIKAAAIEALEEMGVHSAGSPALMGNSRLSLELEQTIADFTGYQYCSLFPTGWAAGYGAIRALVTSRDHIMIDRLAHACLQEGAVSATKNLTRFAHLDNDAVREGLKEIRQSDASNGILVITESLFSMDSDTPNLLELQQICSEFDATLMVDCAHDLGCMGHTGRGNVEVAGLVGKIDVLMGSFSKTFASNGGFVLSRHPALRWFIRYTCNPHTFSNALSPIQSAIVLEAFKVISSEEGAERRSRLMSNILYLRTELKNAGFDVLGAPSPIVPVILGEMAHARVLARELIRRGGIVSLVEYPAVSAGSSRFRLQVMADHTREHVDMLVERLLMARAAAASILA